LAREPLCRLCKQEGRVTLAAELHHLRPLSEGGTNTVDNLVPVCHEHHRSLHTGARQRMGETGRDEAGFSGDEGRRPAAGSFLNACTFSEPVFGGDFHGK
jgi:predicted restriction endonuclease